MAFMCADSRRDWNSGATLEHIQTGCLQRIADATEKMAASYDALRNDRDYWQQRANEVSEERKSLQRTIIALRGVVTRMKNAEGKS